MIQGLYFIRRLFFKTCSFLFHYLRRFRHRIPAACRRHHRSFFQSCVLGVATAVFPFAAEALTPAGARPGVGAWVQTFSQTAEVDAGYHYSSCHGCARGYCPSPFFQIPGYPVVRRVRGWVFLPVRSSGPGYHRASALPADGWAYDHPFFQNHGYQAAPKVHGWAFHPVQSSGPGYYPAGAPRAGDRACYHPFFQNHGCRGCCRNHGHNGCCHSSGRRNGYCPPGRAHRVCGC